jgi:subfamily B ATP-binding cassette protein MsbA
VTVSDPEPISRRDQLSALVRVGKYQPLLTAGIIFGGVFAALLEGVGLSFILPIVEIVQAPGDPAAEAEGVMLAFVTAYQSLGIPFTLGFVVAGVSLILAVRWTTTFIVRWLREALVVDYTREIQKQSFDNALEARVEYFDMEGSDDILNAIVTQAEYAGRTIRYVITFLEQGFMAVLYLGVAFILAPYLTIVALVILGGFSGLFRFVLEPGYDVGEKVAEANERIQEAAQAGTQGIRDTKLFGLKKELYDDFLEAVNQFATSSIKLRRNEQAIKSFYNLLTAISVFALIYLAISFADMSLGTLGVFLFAMFRLGPKASNMNSQLYKIENNLPHLVRTQEFVDELEQNREPTGDSEPVPEEVQTVVFDDVRFSYEGQDEDALSGISFEFEKGDFIGFVGQSGAGKSTIVSLLTRMYEVNHGEIRVNGIPLNEMNINEWRDRLSVVRQDPFIFNDTLQYNLTIGNRGVSEVELDRICEIAKVDEFMNDLPDGYDTMLGDQGVRLSGGQKQRVALARALVEDSDILILDEATSDLDSNLEKQVQREIEEMERDYAIVGIAHRLSTVKNADQIYTVEKGQIIERGAHRDLVKSGGKYAELYGIQSSG